MKVALVLMFGVAALQAAPQGIIIPQGTLPLEEDVDYPAQPYVFQFNIADEIGGVRFAHVSQADEDGVVQGSYSFVRPDGILQTVQYVADENGFRPEVIEETAPVFETNPATGIARHSVDLPYAEEYGVQVSAEELLHYKELAEEQQNP